MTIIDTVKRSRPIQIGLFLFVVLFWYLFSGSSQDSYSPEEINSLLQNKDESIYGIKKTELSTHRIRSPYLDLSTFKPKDWYLAGNTLIKNKEYIRLTSDNQHQVGSMFSNLPIQADSFEMELTFHMHAKSNLVGDGFAIWFVDQKSDIGDVFGAQNNFNGLGIFIDTYKNGKRGHFPYVNLMLGDGHTRYDKDTDGYETRLAGCSAKSILNPSSEQTKARIVYTKDGYFSLDFNYNNKQDEWRNCVTLTDIKLPQIKYLGLSAETGDLSESVDIIENKIFALYKPDGMFIESIEELQQLMRDQSDLQESIEDMQRPGGKHRNKVKNSKIKRKSLKRLQNSEKRIKERERKLRLEKYGDENATFFNRTLSKAVFLLKIVFYTLLVACLIWICLIIYRVKIQSKRSKVGGLLD